MARNKLGFAVGRELLDACTSGDESCVSAHEQSDCKKVPLTLVLFPFNCQLEFGQIS